MSVSYGGDKITFEDGSTVGSGWQGFKNRVINGDMKVAQRATSYAMTNQDSSYRVVDRTLFAVYGSGSWPSGTFLTQTQETDAPSGFTYSYRVTVNQALTWTSNQLGAWFTHRIEGFNVADLAFGTSSAKNLTISFWVKATKTGTLPVALGNADASRFYTTTVTINASNTWEYKTVTIPGDTTGTWNKDNTFGMAVYITPAMNSGWLNAASLNTWLATQGEGHSSQTQFLTSVNDYIAITGLQLEKGSTSSSFEYRPHGTELELCQRYYETGRAGFSGGGATGFGGNTYFNNLCYKVTKRANPTVTTQDEASNAGKMTIWKAASAYHNVTVNLEVNDVYGFQPVTTGSQTDAGMGRLTFYSSAEL